MLVAKNIGVGVTGSIAAYKACELIRELKRAGLDYWDKVQLRIWEDFDQFETALSRCLHPQYEKTLHSGTGTPPRNERNRQ